MSKQCGSCGAPFEAKRPTAKYCSNRCRQRAFKRTAGGGEPEETAEQPASVSEPGRTEAATAIELERAGRLDTAIGQAVIVLARRIDVSSFETGAGLAALAREHRTALAEALRDSEGAADPVDELRMKRERKLAGG